MNLQAAISLRFGGPGSGCNPEVAQPRCGRPSGSGGEGKTKEGARSFTLPNGTKFDVSWDPKKQEQELQAIRKQEFEKLPENVKEGFSKGVDTMGIFSENGVFTPERQALHEKIVHDYLEGHTAQAEPKLVIVAGGTASGKSSASRDAKGQLNDFVYLNSDEFRSKLPEIGAFVGNDKQGLLHEEAGMLRDLVMEAATNAHYNVIMDAPGSQGVVNLANEAEKRGYTVSVSYVHRDVEGAQTAALGRKYHAEDLSDLRDVPTEVTFGSHMKARGAIERLQRGREFRVYDNQQGFNTGKNLVYHRDSSGVRTQNRERLKAIQYEQNQQLPKIPDSAFWGRTVQSGRIHWA